MTRARTNANVSAAVGRNMIINGSMNVAQRSASVTGLGAAEGYFTLDRFILAPSGTAGRLTMSQTADGPNGISANCLKLDCTTADTSIASGEVLNIQHRFEGQNLQRIGKGVAGAKQITVSFYVKASAAFTFGVELFDSDNNRQITKLFDTTTDWVRHEITFPADVDDGSSPFNDDNAVSLYLQFWLHAGATYTGGTLNTAAFANQTSANRVPGIDSFYSSTDNNFFITGVQVEIGPVATEFEQEDISVTLGKCQRYFQARSPVSGGTDEAVGAGLWYSDSAILANFSFQKEMRAFPTMSVSGADWGNAYDVGNNRVTNDTSVFDTITARSARFFIGTFAANGTAGRGTYIQLKNGEYIYADAEL